MQCKNYLRMEIDKKIIKKLIETLEDLKKSLNPDQISDVKNTLENKEEGIELHRVVVKTPIVGTAYLAPEPGAKPFISIGKKIKKGETLMIIEAMKTMNHVPSTSDGIVKKICVDDGQPVEFGQTIVILD